MKRSPTTTVVMPAYNAASTIEMSLKSISEQECPVDAVIIIDDGSVDATADIAEKWLDRLPLTIIRNGNNRGICASLQIGSAMARSEWIFRIDADDRWLPWHTKNLLLSCRDDEVSVVSSRSLYYDESGSFIHLNNIVSDRNVRCKLMWDNPLVHSATGFRRSIYETVGGYGPSDSCQDYYLWIKLLKVGKLGYSAEPSVEYVVGSKSLSRKPKNIALKSRRQAQLCAIQAFGRQYPLEAAACLSLGWAQLRFYSVD
jgi:glycosyltransferase involved in cell wall biosynthesis